MTRTFDLVHGREFALPQIVERLTSGRLEFAGVLAHAGRCGEAALAHARVVPQPALVQVRMGQRIDHRDAFVLKRWGSIRTFAAAVWDVTGPIPD